MGVFPYLLFKGAPLLSLCFVPPDSGVRYELHVRVEPERGLPRTQLFLHRGPGWDTLFLPPSRHYRLHVRVLEGPFLRERFSLDTLLAGMQDSLDIPDPLPWKDGLPACPPAHATGIRIAGPPGETLQVAILSSWGDTLHVFPVILSDGDTVLPFPEQAAFQVKVRGRGRRTGRGVFFLRSPHLLDFLTPEEALVLVEMFGENNESKRFRELSPDARRAFLDSLLAPYDPDPATPANEFLDTLKARIRFARERFREGLRKGLETDRGKVFVRYGPPAWVEEGKDPMTRQDLLVWHYPEQGVAAVFVRVDWTTYILMEIRPE